MRKYILALLIFSMTLTACNLPVQAVPIPAPSETPAAPPPVTLAPTFLLPEETATTPATETSSPTPAPSLTPTETETPGPTATLKFNFPIVTVKMQAHCRYGPNVAYLHAADLYTGDKGEVRGRFLLSKWLLVKFDKLNYFCWVAPSVVDVVGDITVIKFSEVYLPGPSVLYRPPHNVVAVRDGKNVTITWEKVKMTDDDDRGYFLDMFVCQAGAYFWYPVALDNRDKTSYTIKDEDGCPAPSGGKLYAVEKHGYTDPVEINWPQP